mgnify:CR=1 FL=1
MSRRRKVALVALILGSLALVSGILVATSSHDVPRSVIAGGGSRVEGSNYAVVSTMGQGAAGSVGGFGTSANYGACAGFWCIGLPEFNVFLPVVLRAYP